jgi:hypothetical protein
MVTGENNPRYGQKFDFVMIPASCMLIFTVYQKGGVQANTVFKKRKVRFCGGCQGDVRGKP